MKKLRIRFFGFIFLLVFCIPASAQESKTPSVQSFSLKDAQDYAIQHNTQMKNARLDVEIAKDRVWETTATGLPQVNASGSYNDNLKLRTQLLPAQFFDPNAPEGEKIGVQFGTQHNFSGDVNVSQLIFSGSYIVGLQTSRVYKSLSQKQLEKTEDDVKELVTRTYYNILLSENNLGVLNNNLRNLQSSIRETRAMYEEGMVEETDVDQLRISASSLENTIGTTQQLIEVSRNQLKYQLGLELDQSIELTDSLQDFIDQMNLEGLAETQFNPQNHIQYKIMDTQEKLAEMSVKNEKATHLPTLSGYYNYQKNAMRDEFNLFDSDKEWYTSAAIGLSLNVPILSSGQRYMRLSQAQLKLEKTRNTKESVAESLKIAVQQARSNYEAALKKYFNQKENIKLAQKILDRKNLEFKEGVISSMELTQANDQYLQAQSNYTAALVELLNARLQLDKALNKL